MLLGGYLVDQAVYIYIYLSHLYPPYISSWIQVYGSARDSVLQCGIVRQCATVQ